MAKGFITYTDLVQSDLKDFSKVGTVSTESVFKHTRKHWKDWVRILDAQGARRWTYQELVAYLKKKHKLTPWWQQGVALGFEIATGKRRAGQDAKGNYMVTATKSLAHPTTNIWKFLVSKPGLKVWLKPLSEIRVKVLTPFETTDGFFGEIRTLAANRRIRMYWQDPAWEKHTVVELMLVSRPEKKSIVVFNHTGIRDPKIKTLLRNRWREALEQIANAL